MVRLIFTILVGTGVWFLCWKFAPSTAGVAFVLGGYGVTYMLLIVAGLSAWGYKLAK